MISPATGLAFLVIDSMPLSAVELELFVAVIEAIQVGLTGIICQRCATLLLSWEVS